MPRLYVLCRDDLNNPVYSAVQGAHAVAEFLLNRPKGSKWNNEYLLYLKVRNEDELDFWKWKLEKNNIDFREFREPDLDNQLTAIAVETDGTIFRKLELL